MALRFLPPDDPSVTLVMVTYNGWRAVLESLDSIRRNTGPGYEIVVVDNASPDGTGERLQSLLEGVAVVSNPSNLGFGLAANIGAARGRGRYIGFLNPDIAVTEGWLSSLTEALEEDSRAGAACPLFLEPGGDVQEAGRILDGRGLGYGYGDHLGQAGPEVEFSRYVDYGSAATLVVSREAFERVGGFDVVYGTGYYEDADLCFSLRRRGFLTVFEPRAVVTHAGSGSFTSRARQSLSRRNRAIFAERFAEQLVGRPELHRPPRDPHRELVVRDWWAEERHLLVDTDGSLSGLASDLQSARPLDRVTHLTLGPAVGARDGNRFVERVTGGVHQRWLRSRRHHYSSVVLAPRVPAPVGRLATVTQPQATVIGLVDPCSSISVNTLLRRVRPGTGTVD